MENLFLIQVDSFEQEYIIKKHNGHIPELVGSAFGLSHLITALLNISLLMAVVTMKIFVDLNLEVKDTNHSV